MSRNAKIVCKHFNGIMNDACSAGVNNLSVRDVRFKPYRYPCWGEGRDDICPKRVMPSEADLAVWHEQDARADAIVKAMLGGKLSPCCKAKLDESRVVKKGALRGRGPRYCSKCGKLVCIV